MKVTFDSNVWQLIAAPEEALENKDATSFATIYAAILAKRITPFLSDTIFTLEGIDRRNRKEFFGEYRPLVQSTQSTEGNCVLGTVSIGPDKEAHPGNHAYLKKYLQKAVALGFKIIRIPTIGGVINKDTEPYWVTFEREDLYAYMERASALVQRVEELGSGRKPLEQLLSKYPRPQNGSIYEWIARAPESDSKRISTAIAERADGDSVAAHIAIGADFFCTYDGAGNAGTSSIMSDVNVAILNREYGFKKGTPIELAALLQEAFLQISQTHPELVSQANSSA